MKHIVVTIVFIFISLLLAGQNDSLTNNLNEVIITANRLGQNPSDIHASVDYINNDILNASAMNSVDDMLIQFAGIHVVRPLGMYAKSNVSIRGFGANEQGRVLILQDGVPVNSSDLGEVNWNRFSSSVQNIEIYRGPASFVYGSNALGGIINLITKKNEFKSISVDADLSFGTHNTFSAESGIQLKPFKNDKLITGIHAFYKRSDGYISQADSLRDSTHIASWFEEYGLNVNNSFKINANNTVEMSYNFYDDRRSQGIRIYDATGNAADHDTHFFQNKI
jgi:iron complex outermembrane receptor protein